MYPTDEKKDEKERTRDGRLAEPLSFCDDEMFLTRRVPAKRRYRRRHAGATTPFKKGVAAGFVGGIFVYPVEGNNPFHLEKAAV